MYEKIGWEDSPSTKTPILAVSLNQMDNGIEKANKGIVFSYSATFTTDGVIKKNTSSTSLGAGDFATSQTDIVTVFIASNVTSIGSGVFVGCTSLKTIYIDNTVNNISIASGAIPDGVNIVYCNDDSFINVNDLLANAIKSLKTKIVADEEQHKADTTTLSQAIQSVKESAIEEITVVKDTVSDLDKNKVNNIDFNNYKTTNDTAVAKNATDIAQLNSNVLQNAIKNTTPMTNNVVINDSSDSNIVDLMLQDSSAKVYLYGKNLAEFNSYFAKANGWTTVGTGFAGDMVITKDTKNKIVTFNSVNESGRSGINVMWKNSSVDYERLLTKTITISVDVLVTDDCTFFLCNSCDNYKSTTIKLKANQKQRVSVTTTMPSDISKIQNTSILFHIDSTKTNVTLSNFQIELNSVQTDYENYKDSQTVTSDTDLSTVHTNYPTTTVIADNNFQLTYIADTKNYIDNKFSELATALVAHESEVM